MGLDLDSGGVRRGFLKAVMRSVLMDEGKERETEGTYKKDQF